MTADLNYELQVNLQERSYPVRIGFDLLSSGEQVCPWVAGEQVFILSNEIVAPLYLSRLKEALAGLSVNELILPDGEQHKNLNSLARVFDALVAHRHRRTTTILALGGGVIGDLAGFAAACYQRGVAFIQIPTTLLAQVDSSVGGKTAVNHPQGKNMIGAFYQPKLVLADLSLLTTLPEREYRAGIAELVKHAIIYSAELFYWLEQSVDELNKWNPDVLAEALYRSVSIKAEIVAADEREAGLREQLNFGHTFGHALEVVTGYGEWLHGEAVAMGMSLALQLSVKEGWLEPEQSIRVRSLLEALKLPTLLPSGLSADALRTAMTVDKKSTSKGLKLILLEGIGKARSTTGFKEENLRLVLDQAVEEGDKS